MLKVFLVEDEVVMRKGIKNNIPWEKEGFVLVGEASDGELAYPLIKKTKPDILITDIKMPFMDGLELSSIVKKEMPNTKIIILSGYGEFDYAKQAISIGVTDYLLKPISSAKLLESIKEVAAVIEKEQEQLKMMEQYENEMRENITIKRQNLFQKILAGQSSAMEIMEEAQDLGLELTAPAYLVMMFKTVIYGDSSCYSEALVKASKEIMDLAASYEQVLTFDRGLEGLAFVIKGDGEEELQDFTAEFVRALKAVMDGYHSVEYFGGIGSVVQRLRDLSQSYDAASKAFSSRFFTEWNKIISYKDVSKMHHLNEDKIDLNAIQSSQMDRKEVEDFLKNGTIEEVDNFIEEYFLRVGESNYKSLMFRQYIVMDLFACVLGFLEGLGVNPDKLPEELQNINETATKILSIENLKFRLRKLFSEAIQLRDNASKGKFHLLLEEAKHYIKENYYHNDISLNTVATNVNISPSYFSSIFSQETGQTFTEYLTEVRIEKAKELLMCTNLRASEIGYQVGYKDSHYFSYIFKKETGCTPKEYRMRGR